MYREELLAKIEKKTAKVGVVGLGYVGLPLAVEKAKAGYNVIGFDIQMKRVDMVNNGVNYIGDVVDSDLKDIVASKKLFATEEYSMISDVDFVAICVPTPLDKYRQPDTSYVESSCREIAKYMHKGMLIVLESTTYPGTTEDVVMPILEDISGLKCKTDFYLAFSPERVDPGNLIYKTKNTPKVVGGIGSDCTEVAAAFYRSVLDSDIFEASSPKVAEMEKILENTYRNINIALANEMAIICDKMGIDVWEVIEAAKTKPYGFKAFYPGPGVGGHCIPIDPFYLTWKAREYDYHTKLIETASEINTYMPDYIVTRIARILNRSEKAIKGSKILILGVAYKQDIDDFRESPAIKVIEKFQVEGADISYYDPYVPEIMIRGEKYRSIDIENSLSAYDIAILTSCHTTFDYKYLAENLNLIFDTKNGFVQIENRKNIERL
jgi:UDP-N-acetyl-D-glucosamine dehydrogenase